MLSAAATVYRPRNPQSFDYYRCVEDHLETFVQVYEERFERWYGFWRLYLQKVFTRYLECGDLQFGGKFEVRGQNWGRQVGVLQILHCPGGT